MSVDLDENEFPRMLSLHTCTNSQPTRQQSVNKYAVESCEVLNFNSDSSSAYSSLESSPKNGVVRIYCTQCTTVHGNNKDGADEKLCHVKSLKDLRSTANTVNCGSSTMNNQCIIDNKEENNIATYPDVHFKSFQDTFYPAVGIRSTERRSQDSGFDESFPPENTVRTLAHMFENKLQNSVRNPIKVDKKGFEILLDKKQMSPDCEKYDNKDRNHIVRTDENKECCQCNALDRCSDQPCHTDKKWKATSEIPKNCTGKICPVNNFTVSKEEAFNNAKNKQINTDNFNRRHQLDNLWMRSFRCQSSLQRSIADNFRKSEKVKIRSFERSIALKVSDDRLKLKPPICQVNRNDRRPPRHKNHITSSITRAHTFLKNSFRKSTKKTTDTDMGKETPGVRIVNKTLKSTIKNKQLPEDISEQRYVSNNPCKSTKLTQNSITNNDPLTLNSRKNSISSSKQTTDATQYSKEINTCSYKATDNRKQTRIEPPETVSGRPKDRPRSRSVDTRRKQTLTDNARRHSSTTRNEG